LKRIRKWLVPLLCGLVVVLLFRFVFFIGYVPSSSMEPTIPQDSYIFGWRIHGKLNCGDIIIFRREGRVLVKRIAAVPGDVVYICDTDHSVTINEDMGTATRTLTVPDGCYFVLGDNAEGSFDSRFWGNPFLSERSIIAIVRIDTPNYQYPSERPLDRPFAYSPNVIKDFSCPDFLGCHSD
jgi:signal peptidase I